jgi:serine/threonine-protein kinase
VTGQRAFEEESFYILLKKIAEGEFARPSLKRPGLPERMDAIILRAMSLDPQARFESVKQLGAALLEFGSESTRILWTPFFGSAAAVELPTNAAPVSSAPTMNVNDGTSAPPVSRPPSTDRPRVATLVAPSTSPSGATMELPSPSNRKASSTTMRNATGERALPVRGAAPSRWRIPAIVGGVALVAAVALLVVLRGGSADDRRGESDQSASTPATTATRPTEPKAVPVAEPPTTEPDPPPIINRPAEATKPNTEIVAPPTDERAVTTRDEISGRRKANRKTAHKGVAAKPSHTAKPNGSGATQELPPKVEETPATSANGAPVIQP